MINKTQDQITSNWNSNYSEPQVTIKCMAFNHEAYIEQALDSFLMQETNFPFEIIVHDDCSTDSTAQIIKKYEEKFPKIIKPIYETENQYSKKDGSISRIVNSQINSKYIAICEGDDYWCSPYKLQKQFDMMENHTECSICFCKVQCINKDNSIYDMQIPQRDFPEIITLKNFTKEEYYNGHWCFHTSSFFVRTNINKQIQNLPKTHSIQLFPYGDMRILLYMLLNGNGCYINEVMSRYRLFSGGYNSSIKDNNQKWINEENKLITALKAFNQFTEKKYQKDIFKRIERGNQQIALRMEHNRENKGFCKKYLPYKMYLNDYHPRVFKVLQFFKSIIRKVLHG